MENSDSDIELIEDIYVNTEEEEKVNTPKKYCKYCKKFILYKNYARHCRSRIHKVIKKSDNKGKMKIEIVVYK